MTTSGVDAAPTDNDRVPCADVDVADMRRARPPRHQTTDMQT